MWRPCYRNVTISLAMGMANGAGAIFAPAKPILLRDWWTLEWRELVADGGAESSHRTLSLERLPTYRNS